MADAVWKSLRKKRVGYKTYKAGGRVAGEKSKPRLDKMSRRGKTAEEEIDSLGKGQKEEETEWNYKDGGGIKIKPSHKGLLHKDLGVASGKKIPEKKLEKAKNSSDAAVRKRATFAENAKHWHH